MSLFLNEYSILNSTISSQGAFATVYKVKHQELGYIRAIRVLNTTITSEKDKLYLKFLDECKLLLRLGNGGHPNIVRITRPRLLLNKALVEMEFIEGHDLNDYIFGQCKGFVPVDEVINLAVQIGSALAYCHHDIYKFCIDKDEDHCIADNDDGTNYISPECEQILVEKYKVKHNDIHSKNIIRKYDGSFVLLDFGLAIENDSVIKSSATRKGGAMEYKPPEKSSDDSIITEESDIYSFGILLYEVLCGRVPFTSSSKGYIEAQYEVMQQHKNSAPPNIELLRKQSFESLPENRSKTWTKDYPDWLEKMILRCLEKDPAQRYHSGKEFYEELQTHVETAAQLKRAINKLATNNELLAKENQVLQHELAKSTDLNREQEANKAKTREIDFYKKKINTLKGEVAALSASLKNSKTWTYIVSIVAAGFLAGIIAIQFPKTESAETTQAATTDSTKNAIIDTAVASFIDPVADDMVFVSGGTFAMGSDELPGNIEKPVHNVTLKNFSMSRNEITREQWQAVMNDSKYELNESTKLLPADNISLFDARRFCKTLSEKTGKNYRLPYESEWEYAAIKNYPQTPGELSSQLNDYSWNPENSGNKLVAVGTKQNGVLGMYDMLGNVYEWCNNRYTPYGYGTPTATDILKRDTSLYVLRGGSGKTDLDRRFCNPKSRNSEKAGARRDFIGFRIVKAAPFLTVPKV